MVGYNYRSNINYLPVKAKGFPIPSAVLNCRETKQSRHCELEFLCITLLALKNKKTAGLFFALSATKQAGRAAIRSRTACGMQDQRRDSASLRAAFLEKPPSRTDAVLARRKPM
jgi:hypothetical protein